jgi:hypothetical protein
LTPWLNQLKTNLMFKHKQKCPIKVVLIGHFLY